MAKTSVRQIVREELQTALRSWTPQGMPAVSDSGERPAVRRSSRPPAAHERTESFFASVETAERMRPNMTRITFREADGHLYKWDGTSGVAHSLRPGERYLVSGTVERIAGNATWLTRVRVNLPTDQASQ